MTEKSTLITESELRAKCEAEGVDFSKVCVLAPRWAESAPKKPSAQSALVHCDLIIRDDGSAVFLDGAMGEDSKRLAFEHCKGTSNPANLPWSGYVASVSQISK